MDDLFVGNCQQVVVVFFVFWFVDFQVQVRMVVFVEVEVYVVVQVVVVCFFIGVDEKWFCYLFYERNEIVLELYFVIVFYGEFYLF